MSFDVDFVGWICFNIVLGSIGIGLLFGSCGKVFSDLFLQDILFSWKFWLYELCTKTVDAFSFIIGSETKDAFSGFRVALNS